ILHFYDPFTTNADISFLKIYHSQVEIGHEGSEVFVTQRQWDTASSQSSFTTMGISLVRASFETD
ncbi:Protein of unknown function, partial [Cotesia congregata]